MPIVGAHAHLYELWSLALSALALCVSVLLFTLKLGDIVRMKIEGSNGPMLFMALDKIRDQGVLLALCMGMTMTAIAGLNNPTPPSPQALNMILGTAIAGAWIALNGVVSVYRRRTLENIVEKYKAKLKP